MRIDSRPLLTFREKAGCFSLIQDEEPLENLKHRFPEYSPDAIERILIGKKGHAGRTAAELTKRREAVPRSDDSSSST